MIKEEAFKCMSILKAAYPRQLLDAATLTTYTTMLEDLACDDVQSAIQRIICTSKFFPAIAEIRAECTRAVSTLPEPEIAWGEVRKLVNSYGGRQRDDRKLEFSHPEIAAAVDVIGWQTICNDENVTSTRARFVDAYRAYFDGSIRIAQLGVHAPASRSLPERTGMRRLGAAKSVDDVRPDPGELSPWTKKLLEKYESMVDDDKPEGVF